MSLSKTSVYISLLAALALHAAPSQAQTLPDLGGVKLRAPLQAQRAQIAKMNPAYQITEITTTSGQVVGLQGLAFSSVDKKPADQFVALQDESGNVWYMARAQRFDEGKYVPNDTINQALVDKYGDFSSGSPDSTNRYWSFSPQEHQLKKPKDDRCPGANTHFSGGQSLSKIPEFSIFVPSKFYASCGVAIKTRLPSWSRDNNIATGYLITMADMKPRYEALERQSNAEAAARKRESDAMKDNKVKF
ncbi:UNVERIFIED_ORG: hypothetical protein LHJ69_21695 [Shinella sp. XGS7]|nr:hypothetical protein [Shinella sp. XGS7]